MVKNEILFTSSKKCFKYQFNIQIINLKMKENQDLYFIYKRGKYKGESLLKKWKNGEIEFNQMIQFNCSLFKNEKGVYKKKYLKIYFSSISKIIIGEIKMNLSEFIKENNKNKTFIILMNNEKVELTMNITFKKIIKNENNKIPNIKFIDLSNDQDQSIFEKEMSPRKNNENTILIKKKNLSNFIGNNNNLEEETNKIFNLESLDKNNTKNRIDEQENKLKVLQQEFLMKEQESNESQVIDIMIIHQNPKYIENIPITSSILFKSLIHWKGFSSNSGFLLKVQNAMDRIVQSSKQDHRFLCYWLNTSIYLLNLINLEYPNTIPKNDGNEILLKLKNNEFIFEKNEKEGFEFETPVVKFKDFLIKIIHNIYCIQLKIIYEQIQPLLGNIIEKGSTPILLIFSKYLKLLKDNKYTLIESFFSQLFYFINSFLFTNLLNGKFNSMNHSIILKMNITQFEHFVQENNLPISLLNLFMTSRQSCDILIMNKQSLTDESLRKEICPNLNNNQIRKLLLNYKPDQYDEPVSQSIIQKIPISSEKEDLDQNLIFKPIYPLELVISKWKSIEEKELSSFDFLKDK